MNDCRCQEKPKEKQQINVNILDGVVKHKMGIREKLKKPKNNMDFS